VDDGQRRPAHLRQAFVVAEEDVDWLEIREAQAGVVSRQQLLRRGWTTSAVAHRVTSGRWQLLHPGVYATFTGRYGFDVRLWAALLHAGPDAVASHESAGLLQHLVDAEPAVIDVMVPSQHRVSPRPGVRVHRSGSVSASRRPAASIPQTRVEETVLDLVAASGDAEEVIGWLTRACQRRLTTPDRLLSASRSRARMRWRALLQQVVCDVAAGVASPLERHYHRDVECAHGLPRGTINPQVGVRGASRYCDVRYDAFRLRIELEGLAWHPEDQRWRDARRDNLAALAGDVVLRHDWHAVVGRPCATAEEVAAVLTSRGWTGRAKACGPTCGLRSAA
jgi:hypothetical protein